MKLAMHPDYARLAELAERRHRAGRNPVGITRREIDLARLYSYAFRGQCIGAFHATRAAWEALPPASGLALARHRRALELLEDLADLAMTSIADDARALLATFYRCDRDARRVLEAFHSASAEPQIQRIAQRFRRIIEGIATCNGIYLASDAAPLEQASFVVPGLGITIAPLVYGDYHSWNLAYLPGQTSDVPRHRHFEACEIHLGYSPVRGATLLGPCWAEVTEGYAMPIRPGVPHGYANQSELVHHVPFIYGSLRAGGWGVFLDVDPQPCALAELARVELDDPRMNGSIRLEREIARAEGLSAADRRTILPASATDANGSGGLELSIGRVGADGCTLPLGGYRIVSVVRGAGSVRIDGIERAVAAHDHFGVPAGMTASLHPQGNAPFVILDVVLERALGVSQ